MTERLNRGACLAVLAGSLVLFLGLSWWLVPWDWVPGGDLDVPTAESVFTAAEIRRAEDFAAEVRVVAWASYAVSLATALLLGLTRLGSRLVAKVTPSRRWWVTVIAGTLAVLVVGRIVTLPFALVLRDKRLDAGLTSQSLDAWFGDLGKALAVDWGFTALLLVVLVGAARRSPRWWFAWAGGLAVALTFVASLLYPVVVEPLFNTFTPMPQGSLRSSILDLAEQEGVRVDEVLVADASRRTTTLNAYVSGLGGTRRVVVYDNLIRDRPEAEVRSVVAHELAHARHGDVLVGTLLGAVGVLAAVCALALLLDSAGLRRRAGIDGAGDPRAVAAVLALVAVGTFLASPVQNTVSRAIEARADRDALVSTGDVQAFADVQRQLALRSLADPTPPALAHWWWGSHPTVLQRLGLAAWFEATRE